VNAARSLGVALGGSLTLATLAGAAEALRLEEGSIARRQIVAIGQDVVVAGEALEGVTAVDGSVRVEGSGAGGVTVLGGDVHLAATAVVVGDVHVLGGVLHAERGARLEGRSVAYPTFSRAWLTLLEGPAVGLAPGSPLVVAAKLGLVAAWLALSLLLFATSGRALVATSVEVAAEPLRCFGAGLVAVATAALTALLLSAVLPGLVALPTLLLLVIAALVAKLWGMVALFHALGAALARAMRRRRVLALHAAVAGVLLLGALKFVPYLGLWVWSAATLVGVGAALRTKFGRGEAWFAVEPPTAAFLRP
jgi:hypothetical protein